jgi:hypothetical protein
VGIHTAPEANRFRTAILTPATVQQGQIVTVLPEEYDITHVPMGQVAGSDPRTGATLRYIQDLEDAAEANGVVWTQKLPRR